MPGSLRPLIERVYERASRLLACSLTILLRAIAIFWLGCSVVQVDDLLIAQTVNAATRGAKLGPQLFNCLGRAGGTKPRLPATELRPPVVAVLIRPLLSRQITIARLLGLVLLAIPRRDGIHHPLHRSGELVTQSHSSTLHSENGASIGVGDIASSARHFE